MKLKKFISENSLLQGDLVVWMVYLLLCMVSIVEVYSASSTMSYKHGDFWGPIMQHGTFVLTGIFCTWFIQRIPCNWFKLIGVFLLPLSQLLLLATLFISGRTNGATRWLDIGFKFQPSEFAKLGLVIFVAFILSALRDEKGASGLATRIAAAAIGLTLCMIVTENASTAGIIFLVMYGICFYAQVRTKVLVWIGGLLLGGAILGMTMVYSIPESTLTEWQKSEGPLHRVPTWVHRITNKTDLPQDPKDYNITENLQVTHAHIAIATSGVLGKGPGNSVQRDYLPQAYSDFIYAIIIEETGLWGGGAVLFLYLLLMWRAMRISEKCRSLFPSYLVMGLALMIVVQAMVNMAVAVGAFPVTGQPLPLISRGGTSMLVNSAYIGMILSVSRTARKKKEFEEPAVEPAVVAE